MKKYLILAIFLCCISQASARTVVVVGGGVPAAGGTDYTQDANCQGAWFFNGAHGGDGSQSETDRSGNGNTLTVSTSDTIPDSSDVPSGYSGYSRDFEADQNDYLTRADEDLVGLDINGVNAKISIVVWIKIESIASGGERAIITQYNAPSSDRKFSLSAVGTATDVFKIRFITSDTGSNFNLVDSTTTTYSAGTWYHIAAVSNDTDMRIYVNGSLDCTPYNQPNGLYNSSLPFRIGARADTTVPFDGLICEVAVFDRGLSSVEVSEIYNNGISGNKGGSD